MLTKTFTDNIWHNKSSEFAFEQLGVSKQGLSSQEVEARRKEFGDNILPRAEGESVWQILGRQINNPLIYVLLASAALAILIGQGARWSGCTWRSCP